MSFFNSDTAYDNFMGRYSRRLAPKFANFAGVDHGMSVVDVGAGTGALAEELSRRGAQVAAADPTPPFVTALQQRLPGVAVHEAPAENLPWPDERFDAALAQLVVAFMEDAQKGVAEMRRVVRAGGTVAVCMWDREGMEMLGAIQRTQQALSSEGASSERATRYRSLEEIETLFGEGFDDLTSELLEIEADYSGFDEFWGALNGGAGPAGVWVLSLDADARDRARDELYRQVGEPSGPFSLTGRAWATRATRA